MQGTRRDYTDNSIPQPGEYGLNEQGDWYACTPAPLDEHGFVTMATLRSGWQITEHEDGTITVSPSISITTTRGKMNVELWHGFLERGVWREV